MNQIYKDKYTSEIAGAEVKEILKYSIEESEAEDDFEMADKLKNLSDEILPHDKYVKEVQVTIFEKNNSKNRYDTDPKTVEKIRQDTIEEAVDYLRYTLELDETAEGLWEYFNEE